MFAINGFWPARFSVSVPPVRYFNQAVAPTYLKAYPVAVDGVTGLLDECGANPNLIAGIALADNSTNPGYSLANSPATITGRSSGSSISVACDVVEYAGYLVNASAVLVAPAATDVGQIYGIAKYGANWRVDKNLLGVDARVVITGVDIFNNYVLFKVLKAYQQFPG